MVRGSWRGLESLIPANTAGPGVAASLKEMDRKEYRNITHQIFPMRCKACESLQISCTRAAPDAAVTRERALVGPCPPPQQRLGNTWALRATGQMAKPRCGQAAGPPPAAGPGVPAQCRGGNGARSSSGEQPAVAGSIARSQPHLPTPVNSVVLVIAVTLIITLSPKSIPHLWPSHRTAKPLAEEWLFLKESES